MDINSIPAGAEPFFRELSEEQRMWFLSEYHRRSRSLGVMMVLAILFPIQHFFLGRVGLGILFLLTAGGLGIWYLVEWFLTPGRVRAYNEVIALGMLRYLKTASPGGDGSNISAT